MRSITTAILILGALLILPGCQNRDDEAALITPEPIPIEEVATSEGSSRRLSWEDRGEKAEEHFLEYLKLKHEEPDNAAAAFRKAAALLFSQHPLVPKWAELMIRFDRSRKALLPEMIQLTEIELQMVEEDSVPNKEYLRHLKSELDEWNQQVQNLKNIGIDPDKHEIEFRFQEM
ncbi:MAG: hypothetical protein OXD49_11220 [Candidatus Poribacteria bacterium]|nr:hypothetical protein [Candidatus Poribacteria bacterium]